MIPASADQPDRRRLRGALPAAESARDVGQLLHQPAASLRLQLGPRARRPQHQQRQPPVRHRLLEQAPGGPLQLGAGAANATGDGRDQRHPGDPGLRLPHEQGGDDRLHVDALADAAVRCARRAGRSLANGAIPRPSIDPARRSGSSGARSQVMRGYSLPAAFHVRAVQHLERGIDDLLARCAALRLEPGLRPADERPTRCNRR